MMQFFSGLILCGAFSLWALPIHAQTSAGSTHSQAPQSNQSLADADQLPDAPTVQDENLLLAYGQQAPQSSTPEQNAPAPPTGQDSSSAQTTIPPTEADKSQQEKAQEQIKEEEKQRVLGVIPSFNTTYRNDAVSLTAKQKMSLAFRSAVDPVTFGTAIAVAGWGEIVNSDTDNGFGWGPEGFAKRSGAKYLDAFDGTMIGNGILPSLLHQDPRYFRLGHGSITHRTLYAIATSFICKHDNSNRWEPNYSNVGGNLIAGAISNFYYPTQNGWSTTIINAVVVTAEGTAGGVFQEFWPDISRKILHRDPTHGLDSQTAATDGAPQEQKHSQGR